MATLTEIKTETEHYFKDESDQIQGEYKQWYDNGKLCVHCFYVVGKQVIDFMKEPEEYPTSDERKTYFALKYGWIKWL
jgi:antitoxin component YwqK of YwqJK toxin-antitoxin module